MDPGFAHCHIPTQKIRFISAKQLQTALGINAIYMSVPGLIDPRVGGLVISLSSIVSTVALGVGFAKRSADEIPNSTRNLIGVWAILKQNVVHNFGW